MAPHTKPKAGKYLSAAGVVPGETTLHIVVFPDVYGALGAPLRGNRLWGGPIPPSAPPEHWGQ